ncbi:MAG: hypothetical protein JRI86_10250 [Deltaproteobacteria bacterium]|nr:hypothetical protein [Deltaproteobacteria bacterium]
MKINSINVYNVSLPFVAEFAHSLRKRLSAKNILVEIVADNGTVKGYGEGAPRTYVTGESQESAVTGIKKIIKNQNFPWEINDVSRIWDFIESLPDTKECNVGICALENALLDALGKKHKKAISDFFSPHSGVDHIFYGGAVMLASKLKMIEVCRLFKKININKLKLKMGKNFEQNRNAFKAVRQVFGDDYDLKVDVNMAWDFELALENLPLLQEYNVKVLEQPMMPDDPDIAEFAEILKENDIVLMADESACCMADIKKLVSDGHYKMVNVRLSKCGGFRRSLEIIDYLLDNNISFQIAAHLGESGFLSAAGRTLGFLCEDSVYYDGSYDEYLLKENLTKENVTFGIGGKAAPLADPGLGVELSNESLQRLGELALSIER